MDKPALIKRNTERRAQGWKTAEISLDDFDALIAENEALRKDAARIDFIEKEWFYVTEGNNQEFCFVETWSAPGETLRDAIDAAMGKGEQS